MPAGSSSERPARTPGPTTAAKATTRLCRRAWRASARRTVRARVTVLTVRAYEPVFASGRSVLALGLLLHLLEPRVVVGKLVQVRKRDLARHDRIVVGHVRS